MTNQKIINNHKNTKIDRFLRFFNKYNKKMYLLSKKNGYKECKKGGNLYNFFTRNTKVTDNKNVETNNNKNTSQLTS